MLYSRFELPTSFDECVVAMRRYLHMFANDIGDWHLSRKKKNGVAEACAGYRGRDESNTKLY